MLIGAAAALLLWGSGRIAGISGIAHRIFVWKPGDTAWRIWFVAGLVAAGFFAAMVHPEFRAMSAPRPITLIVIGGLLVGFGTSLGSGCTSGHGVCGIGRGSKRSIVATLVFMGTGALIATWLGNGLGGAS
jgi:uncharacterized membrane protein YedE/YeeE